MLSDRSGSRQGRLPCRGRRRDAAIQRHVGLDEELKAAYEQAHNLYLAFRHELAGRLGDSEEHIEGTSAGGMPVRVKCLHALLAQSLVMGPGVNPIGDLVLERVKDEFDPTVCRCTLDD